MKTRLLGLAVVLVALAVIVNALALESATINGTSLSANIVSSDSALIAIVGGAPQDSDIAFDGTGTTASISLEHGIQANSTYVFGHAFGIKNNSDDNVRVTVAVADGSGATLTLTPVDGTGATLNSGSLTNIPLSANSTPVYFKLTASTGAVSANATGYSITVTATKAP